MSFRRRRLHDPRQTQSSIMKNSKPLSESDRVFIDADYSAHVAVTAPFNAESHRKLIHFMQGWHCAAGCRPIPPELHADRDFNAGWAAGKSDARTAASRAELEYRSTLNSIHVA